MTNRSPRISAHRKLISAIRIGILGCSVALATAVPAQSGGDPSRGAARATACASCHGAPEREPLANTPSLAGQQVEFLVLQMVLLREGLRDAPQMAGTLNGYSDRDLADVAAYYSGLALPRGNGKPDPTLHARGAALSKAMGCGSCHLGDYRGQKQVPRLSNQREDYLVTSMRAYRNNKRTGADTSMNGILYRIPDADIRALAHYLAHQ